MIINNNMHNQKKTGNREDRASMEIIHPHQEVHLKEGEIVEITKDMVIGDVILAYPEAAQVMRELGIHCVGCHGAAYESIEEGAAIHRLNPEKICEKINQVIKKTHKKQQ